MTPYYSIIRDEKLPATRFSRVSFLTPGDTTETTCTQCGKTIKHGGSNEGVKAAFCTKGCFDQGVDAFFPKDLLQVSAVSSTVKVDRPRQCEQCGGQIRPKGYAHEESCPDSTPNKLKAAAEKSRAERGDCPVCSGPAISGKSWQHTDDCTKGQLASEAKTVRRRRSRRVMPSGAA